MFMVDMHLSLSLCLYGFVSLDTEQYFQKTDLHDELQKPTSLDDRLT